MDSQIGELARRTGMDPAATGRQVAQLVEDGLVTREKASEDSAVIVPITSTPVPRCAAASAW